MGWVHRSKIKHITLTSKPTNLSIRSAATSEPVCGLRWHDIKGWEKVVLWFDGIREPAEGSNYW